MKNPGDARSTSPAHYARNCGAKQNSRACKAALEPNGDCASKLTLVRASCSKSEVAPRIPRFENDSTAAALMTSHSCNLSELSVSCTTKHCEGRGGEPTLKPNSDELLLRYRVRLFPTPVPLRFAYLCHRKLLGAETRFGKRLATATLFVCLDPWSPQPAPRCAQPFGPNPS